MNQRLPKLAPLLATAALLSMFGLPSSARSSGEDGDRQERRGPPPEAVESCANLAQDSQCTFEGRRGTVQGTCVAPPRDDLPLACRPDHHGERPERAQASE